MEELTNQTGKHRDEKCHTSDGLTTPRTLRKHLGKDDAYQQTGLGLNAGGTWFLHDLTPNAVPSGPLSTWDTTSCVLHYNLAEELTNVYFWENMGLFTQGNITEKYHSDLQSWFWHIYSTLCDDHTSVREMLSTLE